MFPYEIRSADGERKELLKSFIGQKGFVEVGPKKWMLPFEYSKHAEKYYNVELRNDDIWIMTFPRSGTTWMQELLWLVNNNLDYETAAAIPLNDRFPFFEYNMIFCEEFLNQIVRINKENPKIIQALTRHKTPGYILGQNMKSPRHFKTHLPPSLFSPKLIDTCKVVYIARNPLDAAVSLYHHNQLRLSIDYQGDFEKFWELFEKNLVFYAPYWEHIKEGWAKRNHPNFLFLFYEELLMDLPSNIKKISKFLNKSITDDQINRLAKHLHIDNFRKNVNISSEPEIIGLVNPNAQNFIRRGKIGGNEEFTEELKIKAMKWFQENLAKTDIKFPEFKV